MDDLSILVASVIEAPTEDLVALAKATRLDPTTDFVGLSLSAIDLSYQNLEIFNFTSCDLTDAILKEVNLSKTDLSKANLTGANLTGANLTGANLTGANLTGANLVDVMIADANLFEAQLTRADMKRAILDGANLCKADLGGTDLSGACLEGVNLAGANISEANFLDAWVRHPESATGGVAQVLDKIYSLCRSCGRLQSSSDSRCRYCGKEIVHTAPVPFNVYSNVSKTNKMIPLDATGFVRNRQLGLQNKRDLLQALVDEIAGFVGIRSTMLLRNLMERERLGTTGVGGGIALPYAMLDGLDRLYGFFFRLETVVDFDALDDRGCDLIFVLLAPSEAHAEALRALARVSRHLRKGERIDQLRGTTEPRIMYEILTRDYLDQTRAA